MKAGNWIDRVKTVKGLPSDYAAAKELGLSRFTVSGYRQRPDATFDEDIAVKVAHTLGINPILVLTDQAMERAKNAEARTAWGTILERLGGVAAAALVGFGVGTAPAPSTAQTVAQDGSSVYYVKSRKWPERYPFGSAWCPC